MVAAWGLSALLWAAGAGLWFLYILSLGLGWSAASVAAWLCWYLVFGTGIGLSLYWLVLELRRGSG